MLNTHVLIDVPYLGYVSFHGMRGRAEHPDTILESMLDRIRQIVQEFGGQHVLFCFDGPPPLHRATMFKGYKAHRQKAREQKDPEELEKLDEFRKALWEMPGLLTAHGFAVACQPGYEADDMLAEAVKRLSNRCGNDIILVTSDEDMFQCFAPGVTMYTPAAKYPVRNAEWLLENYGVTPAQWAKVKAIAGCTSDGVPGVPGVGEKTACKYLTGTLAATTKAYASIEHELDNCKARMPLVRIPWPHATLPDDWLLPARKWSMEKFHALSAYLLSGEAATQREHYRGVDE